jgi:polysaccharide export outer membrane protein
MMRLSFGEHVLRVSALSILLCGASLPLSGQIAGNAPVVQELGTFPTSVNSGGQQASGGNSASAVMSVPEDFSKLKIAPGFLLNIQALEAPDISGDFRVQDSGDVSLPLTGIVHLSGLSTTEAQHVIEERMLNGQILNHPQVTVSIHQYAPFIVAVTGEVARPGRIELLAPHTLLDVLSQVGGETPIAGNAVIVKHLVNGIEQDETFPYRQNTVDSSLKDVMIKAGDTIVVPRAGIVYILGAVVRPGGYLMQEDGTLNVAQALSLALGTTLQGKVGGTRIIRHKSDGTEQVIPVDYARVMSGRDVPLVLAPQDIVYVPVSKVKTVFTTGASLIGAAATSSVYAFRP